VVREQRGEGGRDLPGLRCSLEMIKKEVKQVFVL